MAAPAHYIRTIHTSFTAAHPHSSSAWANAASSSVSAARSQAQNHHQHAGFSHQHPEQPSGYSPSINSHNQYLYTHHLQEGRGPRMYSPGLNSPSSSPTPSASGAGSRRRSSSVRMPPASHIKFDPFADDPLLPSSPANPDDHTALMPLASGSQANRSPPPNVYSHPGPYTIHIPAAAPTEIQRYTPPPSSRRIVSPIYTIRTSAPGSGGVSASGQKRFPATSSANGNENARMASGPGALGGPNVSKLVAGILLNRVQVGKPMRRRVPSLERREYVKSCLSSVVSVEA